MPGWGCEVGWCGVHAEVVGLVVRSPVCYVCGGEGVVLVESAVRRCRRRGGVAGLVVFCRPAWMLEWLPWLL